VPGSQQDTMIYNDTAPRMNSEIRISTMRSLQSRRVGVPTSPQRYRGTGVTICPRNLVLVVGVEACWLSCWICQSERFQRRDNAGKRLGMFGMCIDDEGEFGMRGGISDGELRGLCYGS
jgi:hypothetical protein